MKKILKIISGTVYGIGTCITLVLSIIYLSRSDVVINPDAMLPSQLYEDAFILLAFGALPMIIVCYAVYKIYGIKHRNYKILVFIPGIICVSCAVFVIGVLLFGMFNIFVLHS